MNRPLSGHRIGIVGKGGSGKSTVVALLAGALNRRGYQVFVLDADSTNVGLHEALGVDREPRPLLDLFGGSVFSGGRVTCPVDDPTLMQESHLAESDLDEAFLGRSPTGIRLLVAGKLGEQGPGAGCDGPIAKIARDVRILADSGDAVTLVDCKAGFEDTARGVIVGLDTVLVVVDPTGAALRIAVAMDRIVQAIRAGGLPATEHLQDPDLVALARRLFRESSVRETVVALNKVPDADTRSYLRDVLAAHGIVPVAEFAHDPDLGRAWLTGTALRSEAAEAEADHLVDRLEADRAPVREEAAGRERRPDPQDERLKGTFPASDPVAQY
jgi:CO dehydrogenase maturation factor